MAKNTTKRLINELERVYGVLIYESPVKAAERVVTELQQEGPIWTGEYANSWQIEAAGTVVKGNGQGGSPRPLKMPKLTTKQKRSLRTNKVIISNFSEKAGYAQDETPGRFRRFTPTPLAQGGKWVQTGSGRKEGEVLRPDIGGGSEKSVSSRTADLDWYPTYLNSGKLSKAITVETDKALKKSKGGGF